MDTRLKNSDQTDAPVSSIDEQAERSAPKEDDAAISTDNDAQHDVHTETGMPELDDVHPHRALKLKNSLPEAVKINKRSFLALLIRVFVFMIVTTIVAVSVVFMLANWAGNNNKINTDLRDIPSYQVELEQGRYNAIPLARTLGKSGWLDIVDPDGNVVFSSHNADHYTQGELDCVTNYGSNEVMRYISFKGENDASFYLLTRTYSDGSERYLLLDDRLVVQNGNLSTTKTQFTQTEFDFLTFNGSNQDRTMNKYSFTGDDGILYTAVFLDANIKDNLTPYIFFAFSAIGLAVLVTVMFVFFILYINKHVQRPIQALGTAMKEFARGGYLYETKLGYQGSVDFEELIDSFNDMVQLLNASERQRVALEDEKQRMLAGLSHDLKTPITVIQGFSKAIRDGVIAEEDKPKYLNLIIAKAENMGELVNSFYEYSKLDHPDFELDLHPTDIAELARSYLAERYDEFYINGYQLVVDITEDRLFASADSAQLKRVFENLINNFFKYTRKGSELKFSVQRRDNDAFISVADNGEGIRPEARADIFKPFVVGEQSRNKQGSGLGLAVCQKIVEAHNGTIKLSNSPEDGFTTQFEILIPLMFPDDEENS